MPKAVWGKIKAHVRRIGDTYSRASITTTCLVLGFGVFIALTLDWNWVTDNIAYVVREAPLLGIPIVIGVCGVSALLISLCKGDD